MISNGAASPQLMPKFGPRRSALITGASGALGRELAIAFLQLGHVILSGRDTDRLSSTAQACKDPSSTTLVYGNLSSSEVRTSLASFADIYNTEFLICCAGEYLGGKFETTDKDKIPSVLNTNLTDTISLVRSIYPIIKRNMGTIIAINSVAGRSVASNEPVYCASKFGLTGFFESFRYEARQSNVRILDVFLGGMASSMTIGRQDWNKLIWPAEAAKIIYHAAVESHVTVAVEQLHLGRTRF